MGIVCSVIIIITIPIITIVTSRRKFRSQTFDNRDRWKAEMGRVREDKRRRKKIKEEKFRRKKIQAQAREKVGKSRLTVFSNGLWLRRVEK